MYQRWHETEEERLLLSEEGVCVAHGTAQYAADYVSRLGVARQLAVGYRECYRTQVVGNNAHGHVGLLIIAVLLARQACYLFYYRLEYVRVIIRVLALQGAHQALEAHARVDYVHRKLFKRTVSLAVELHEHEVPYLDYLWVVLVHKFASRHFCLFLRCT